MSTIFAQVFGYYFIMLGLAFILNPNRFKRFYPSMMKDENFLLLGGIVAFFIGIITVIFHNLWTWDLRLLTTVVGWLALTKGTMLIIFPTWVHYFSFFVNQPLLFYRGIGVFWLIIGCLLLFTDKSF